MGLGPIMSLYQARFNRYLQARGLVNWKDEPKVWAFLGDGECDEPESLGAITLGARENLDNFIWVVNCNLQRLDGPVRGNGKIIQELEGLVPRRRLERHQGHLGQRLGCLARARQIRPAAQAHGGMRGRRLPEIFVEPGSYTRKHFFGKYPELLELVNHLTDEQISKLLRGGHDARKMYAAYKAAMEHKGQPTVILAKTVKGYGLGEAGEGKNISHQQKKMNEKELREFPKRFNIPISDDVIAETPFFRPPPDSPEMKYLLERRKALGGFLPARVVKPAPLDVPKLADFERFFKGRQLR
jgi:pyruvate dehydrogenase E1 component